MESVQNDIADVLARLFHALDDHDWSAIDAICADPIDVDYPSKEGGPETMPRQTFLAGLQGLLPGFDATHHLMGVPATTLVEASATTTQVDVRVTHLICDQPGGSIWSIGVRYSIGLVRERGSWKIGSVRSRVIYEEGNRTLEEVARTRAKRTTRSVKPAT